MEGQEAYETGNSSELMKMPRLESGSSKAHACCNTDSRSLISM